jgi:hypothetical protein
MRLAVAVLLTLFALPAAAAEPEWRFWGAPPNFAIGTAAAPGLTGVQAAFITGNEKARNWQHGAMEQTIPAESWRGRRVSLTLRLKNDDGARAAVALRVVRANAVTFEADVQRNAPGSDAWQSHHVVMDVAADATTLVMRVSTRGKGTAWVEGVRMEAVGAEVPATHGRRWPQRSLFDTALDGSFSN